ncbi:MAG: hypothetical protein GDA56_07025 [Hormoscilla sp. GM7CHS1pb]|nr:hypothetical protein [Hormoscilla sp. GM7CHS1pb]
MGTVEWRSPTRGQYNPRVSRFFPYFSIYVLAANTEDPPEAEPSVDERTVIQVTNNN